MTTLTAEQKSALDALTPKRRRFVLFFCGEAEGHAGKAARMAGYAAPDQEGPRLLQNAKVQAAIESLRAPKERDTIATIEELRAFWTRVARGEELDIHKMTSPTGGSVLTKDEPDLKTRMRATELLGKSQGAFLEKVQVDAGPSLTEVVSKVGEILKRKQAREAGDGE